jgi:hypothetical protein
MGLRALFTGVMLTLAPAVVPAVAQACSPAMRTPAAQPVRGDACALRIDLDEVNVVSLSAAQGFGAGLSIQKLTQGNACDAALNLVVHDCAAGAVLIIGTEHFALMEAADGAPSPLDDLRRRALADTGADLARVAALSEQAGFGAPLQLRPDQALQFGRHRLPLGCVCGT